MTENLLACPSHLSGEARREWKRVSKGLGEHGLLLTETDRDTLAEYCQAWADAIKAQRRGVICLGEAWRKVQDLMIKFGLAPTKR